MEEDTDDEPTNVRIKLLPTELDRINEYINPTEVHENRREEVANGLQEIDGTMDGHSARTTLSNWFAISMEMRNHDEDGLRAPEVGRRINGRLKREVDT